MQGLVVVPLFGGFDERRDAGRLFYYDATGGRWEEQDYQATGSGAQPAKNSLKKRGRTGPAPDGGVPAGGRAVAERRQRRRRPGLTQDEGLRVAVEAVIDAAEDDVATGGPDLARGIFPVVMTVTSEGAKESTDEDVANAVRAVVETRP